MPIPGTRHQEQKQCYPYGCNKIQAMCCVSCGYTRRRSVRLSFAAPAHHSFSLDHGPVMRVQCRATMPFAGPPDSLQRVAAARWTSTIPFAWEGRRTHVPALPRSVTPLPAPWQRQNVKRVRHGPYRVVMLLAQSAKILRVAKIITGSDPNVCAD